MDDRLYFRQLLAGRDFARSDPVARQMANFVYLIGDRDTGEAVVVDPAYSVTDLLEIARADDMEITGALATHYHPDHIGGSMMGMTIEGVSELLAHADVPIHIQADEAEWIKKVTDIEDSSLVLHRSGDVVEVGGVEIELIHTPGHTPGSQCFLVRGGLVAGDTLFLDGCGRTDLPGADPAAMFDSLHHKLARIPDRTILYPGHNYSTRPAASMGETRQHNFVFKPRTEQEWLAMFGAG
ncbi:MAG TPA: MBL fold metallo-hydrolase [Acidimicrobiales bacterium]|nr:MBL fold metallo-hydrolase [Acidimicrobiales bacterium]